MTGVRHVIRGGPVQRWVTGLLLWVWLAGQVPWPVPASLRTPSGVPGSSCAGRLCGCSAGLCAERCCCSTGRSASPLVHHAVATPPRLPARTGRRGAVRRSCCGSAHRATCGSGVNQPERCETQPLADTTAPHPANCNGRGAAFHLAPSLLTHGTLNVSPGEPSCHYPAPMVRIATEWGNNADESDAGERGSPSRAVGCCRPNGCVLPMAEVSSMENVSPVGPSGTRKVSDAAGEHLTWLAAESDDGTQAEASRMADEAGPSGGSLAELGGEGRRNPAREPAETGSVDDACREFPAENPESLGEAGDSGREERSDGAVWTLSRANCRGESWQVLPPPLSVPGPTRVSLGPPLNPGGATRAVSERVPRCDREPPIPPPRLA